MTAVTCPSCGFLNAAGSTFCGKCGSALPPAVAPAPPAPASTPAPRPQRPSRVIAASVLLVIVVVVLAVYYFGVFVPQNDVVTTQNGSWIINGASGSLAVSVGCSNCGQKPLPGATFTVDLNVQVASASCGYFSCPGYAVQSISVNSPYDIVTIAPANLPYTEPQGGFNTWALTLLAPSTAGHYPLGGIVAVSYE